MVKINVKDTEVSVIRVQDEDYISLTDMLKVFLFQLAEKPKHGGVPWHLGEAEQPQF